MGGAAITITKTVESMDVKTIVSLECPDSVLPKPDGTVARELIERRGFKCPQCKGSGLVMAEDGRGGLEKVQCHACLGFGTLKVRLLAEWMPDEKVIGK